MKRHINVSRIAFWIGLAVVAIIFISLVNEGGKSYRLHNQADEIEGEISQLKADNEELTYQIAYYNTDSYKERLVREKLGLQLPGESVVIVEGSHPTAEASSINSNPIAVVPTSNFQAWLEFLFGK